MVKVVQDDEPTALKRKSYLPVTDTASHEADAELKPILETLTFVGFIQFGGSLIVKVTRLEQPDSSLATTV